MTGPEEEDREPQTVTYIGTAPKSVTIELHHPDGSVTREQREVAIGDTIEIPKGVKKLRVSP